MPTFKIILKNGKTKTIAKVHYTYTEDGEYHFVRRNFRYGFDKSFKISDVLKVIEVIKSKKQGNISEPENSLFGAVE